MRSFLATTLTIVLLVSLMVTWTSGSLVASGDSHEDDDFETKPRVVEPEVREQDFELRSWGEDGDRLRVEFQAPDGELRLDFTPSGNGTVELQLKLRIEGLLEYQDEDGDGAFDIGEDVLQEFEMSDMVPQMSQPESLGDGYRIDVNYWIVKTDATFGLTFYIFQNETSHQGVMVRPTEVKFDVSISAFPFEGETTRLAMAVDLWTEVEPQANFTGTEAQLGAIGASYEGFFRWGKVAKVDGVETPVHSTIVEQEGELESEAEPGLQVKRTVVLSYGRGQSIVHDPFVGVTRAPSLPPVIPPGLTEQIPPINVLTYGVMLGVATLFVIGTVLVRRRRGG